MSGVKERLVRLREEFAREAKYNEQERLYCVGDQRNYEFFHGRESAWTRAGERLDEIIEGIRNDPAPESDT